MLGVNSMKDRHLEILKEIKFNTSRHKMYSWKHTGVVTFVKNNGNLKDLQTQLRHHSLDQVNDYLKDMGVYQSEFIKNLPSI